MIKNKGRPVGFARQVGGHEKQYGHLKNTQPNRNRLFSTGKIQKGVRDSVTDAPRLLWAKLMK